MFSVWSWRSPADARRSRRARFRVLLAATCHECSHPFVEHIPDAHPLDDHICSECVYEIEHGFRGGPPCRRPIPTDLLHRAEAAARIPERSGGGGRRRRSDTERPRDSVAANLREANAALMLGLVTTRDVVALAADQLAAGDDGASLCALASLYAEATPCDVFDLSSAALVEAGERPLDRDGEEVPLLALRVACRRFLAGDWKLRSFSSWVHDRIGHTGPDAAQPLVEFDDELDARNGKGDREYHARAVRLAAAFLVETGGFASDTP